MCSTIQKVTIVVVVDVREPRATGLEALGDHLVLCGQGCPLLVEVLDDELGDVFRVLVGHGANRELADDLGRDHSLCTLAVESTLDAVQAERGEAPAAHEGGTLLRENGRLAAEGLVKVLVVKVNVLVQVFFIVCKKKNFFFEKKKIIIKSGGNNIPVTGATESRTPGMRMLPLISTRRDMIWIRSVMGSCTEPP